MSAMTVQHNSLRSRYTGYIRLLPYEGKKIPSLAFSVGFHFYLSFCVVPLWSYTE
jgi:hypothetical protein